MPQPAQWEIPPSTTMPLPAIWLASWDAKNRVQPFA
jgi:hypothetical protein